MKEYLVFSTFSNNQIGVFTCDPMWGEVNLKETFKRWCLCHSAKPEFAYYKQR